MYYAFAIVKRVRAALRALRAPRLSELAWRSRACSYAAVPTRACRYTCVSVYSLSPARKEEERERRRKDCSDDAVTVANSSFPDFFSLLSSLSSPLCSWSNSNSKKRGNVQGWEVSGFVGTRAEFAGLSRLIRGGGIRKRAE